MVSIIEAVFGLILVVVGLTVVAYVANALLPGALTGISTTTITSAAAGIQPLYSTLFPMLLILAVVIGVLGVVFMAFGTISRTAPSVS